MADISIAALPTLAATSIQSDDILPIVDVHDLTSPTGTTKGTLLSALRSTANIANGFYNVQNYLITGQTSWDTAVLNAQTAAVAAGTGIYFAPGTYTFANSQTLTAPVTMAAGAKLSPASAKVITITGVFTAPLVQVFTGAGSILFVAGVVQAVYPEWWYNASGDWHDAILGAINSLPTANDGSGIPLRFTGDTYITSRIIVPANGAQARSQCWEGVPAAGGGRVPVLSFTSTPGAGVGQLDFSAITGSYLHMSDLMLQHNAGIPTDTTHGVGLLLSGTSSTYTQLRNVWIQYFDVGLSSVNGFIFYSDFFNVDCTTNYSKGMFLSSAVVNGTPFTNCTFSRTVNGPGALITNPRVAMKFKNCYFESNSSYGLNIQNMDTTELDTCYFELNGNYDAYVTQGFPYNASLLKLSNCYFDEDLSSNHHRVRLQGVRALIENCHFYDSDGTPPIAMDLTGALYPFGGTPNIALNNDYATATFSTDDRYWDIVDCKHPNIRWTANNPANLNVRAGSLLLNNDEATLGGTMGYLVTQGGYLSTVPTLTVTATTTATSKVVTLSSYTGANIRPGDLIQIAGVDFGGGAASYATVMRCDPAPNHLTLDLVCNQTVAGAAISFRAATKIAITSPQAAVASGGAAPAGGTGATAGAYDTSAHRDALITLVNNMRNVMIAWNMMT